MCRDFISDFHQKPLFVFTFQRCDKSQNISVVKDYVKAGNDYS